jgi:hypothetical protein
MILSEAGSALKFFGQLARLGARRLSQHQGDIARVPVFVSVWSTVIAAP